MSNKHSAEEARTGTDLVPVKFSRLTRRGVLLHRLLALDLLHEDAVAEALAALGLPRS